MKKVSVMPMGNILTNTVMEEQNGWYSVVMEAALVSAPIYYKPTVETNQRDIHYGKFQEMFLGFPLAKRYAVDQAVGNFFWNQLRLVDSNCGVERN